MASYNIQWKRSATKDLKRLSPRDIPRIVSAVEQLSNNPFPGGARKLVGSEHTFRIRVGVQRVIYSVVEQRLIIEILRVRHRKDVYK